MNFIGKKWEKITLERVNFRMNFLSGRTVGEELFGVEFK
jgi:hypothetical protein